MATKAKKKVATGKAVKRPARLKKDTLPRAFLAREVRRRLEKFFGHNREWAAYAVGEASSQMSRLMVGHIAEFSADRLAKMLLKLGSDVTVTVRHQKTLGRRGKVRARVA